MWPLGFRCTRTLVTSSIDYVRYYWAFPENEIFHCSQAFSTIQNPKAVGDFY